MPQHSSGWCLHEVSTMFGNEFIWFPYCQHGLGRNVRLYPNMLQLTVRRNTTRAGNQVGVQDRCEQNRSFILLPDTVLGRGATIMNIVRLYEPEPVHWFFAAKLDNRERTFVSMPISDAYKYCPGNGIPHNNL